MTTPSPAPTKPAPYGASATTLNDYLAKTNQSTDSSSVSELWNGAFGSFGTKYSGSNAQNAALLHALQTGYKGSVDNKTISGSSSAKNNINTSTAMVSGSKALGNTSIGGGTSTAPVTAPVSTNTPTTNPTISSYKTATSTAIDQAHQDSSVALQPVTDTYNQNLQTLLTSKANAVAGAKATYAKANPYGAGSDQDEFISGIEKSFDTQIENLRTSYADEVLQNSQQLQDNVNTINATYAQNVQAYQENQTKNLQWTLENDPPTPLDTKGIKSQKDLQAALMQWGGQNQELVDQAFSTGQYGDENNMQDYLNVVSFLSHPTKSAIEEQTSQDNVDIARQRVGIEGGMLGVAQKNAATSADNAGATTTTTKPGFFQGLWDSISGKGITSTSTKTPGGTVDTSDFNAASFFQ